MFTQYKVISVSEGALGTLFFGASKIPIRKLEDVLNDEARAGWQVAFQLLERKRFLLFWARETVVVTLGKA